MLKVSADQLKVLQDRSGTEFDAMLTQFLRDEFPTETAGLPDTQLQRICERVVEAARGFGIDEAVPIAQLACLAVSTQGQILTQPDVVAYLSDPGLPPTQRVQLLVDELSAAD
ncbi:MAG: hypothetical protein JWQ76_3629 [Ramlibacter sp.]|nr:hypothetical protein [Ramlibacter sp.]